MSTARLAAEKTRDLDVFHCPLDGLHLIEASAGTGKTWNICGLYLRLLLEKALPVEQILVVTFTNAATAELRARLRSRIVDVLDAIRQDHTTDDFVARLLATTAERLGGNRQVLCRRLEEALLVFDEAAVFTVHGFCQRVLSETPFAFGLPFAHELLHDDSALQREIVHDFWRRHVAGGRIAPRLADYLLHCKDSPLAWATLLGRQLNKPGSRILWPEDEDSPSAAIDTDALQAAFDDARRHWGGDGAAATAALLAGFTALNANSYREEPVRTAARAWCDWLNNGEALIAPDPEASKMRLFCADFIAGRTKKRQEPPEHPFFHAAAELLRRQAATTGELRRQRLHLLRQMLAECDAALRATKRKQRVLSFDDLLFHMHAALTAEQAGDLAESLRRRYPAALIDEFQDTDPVQYAIFTRLYGTATARATATTLFLVGDPKQAIYRFRNADLHTYLLARQDAGTPYTLRHNQRSTASLIEACNALFTANPGCFILAGLDYETVKLGSKPRPTLVDCGISAAALRLWRLPTESGQYLLRAQAMQRVLSATAIEVARLLRAGSAGKLTIGERPLAPADMAILVRSHRQGRLIREALQQVGVGSVELSQQSVFHTADAEELERLLLAILEPTRPPLLFAALANESMGFDAAAIDRLAADESLLLQTLARFTGYRETWRRRGFGVMFRSWLGQESIAARLLARRDGERRLTNWLHLGELLQQAEDELPAPDALLRWLAGQRRAAANEENAQLRLESDRNLVRIVTIHKAKGLEYGIVFCPFLWDGHPSRFGEPEGREYHDDDGRPVIDFRIDIDREEAAAIDKRRRIEQDAEFMRLLYVALTRAVHRTYLVVGSYATLAFGKPSLSQGDRSLLNWLVAGKNMSYSQWLSHQLTTPDIAAAWQALAEEAAPHVSLSELPNEALVSPEAGSTMPLDLCVPTPPRVPTGWRIASFTSLQHGAASEVSASDHDGRAATAKETTDETRDERPSIGDDFLDFPRGPAAGDCVHALFEHVDFTHRRQWPSAIAQALAEHPQTLPEWPAAEAGKRLTRMLQHMLHDVLTTSLPGGIVLAALPRSDRLAELAFNLPATGITASTLNDWLRTHHYVQPRLTFPAMSGYLKGFIDLVFRHAGRYYILDWKSNHLGYTAADYRPESLAIAMSEHGYHLQYLLYSIALQRYLRRRLPDYEHARHFGGVFYLFVRGMRPDWQAASGSETSTCGVYRHRPSATVLDSLDALLSGPPAGTRC